MEYSAYMKIAAATLAASMGWYLGRLVMDHITAMTLAIADAVGQKLLERRLRMAVRRMSEQVKLVNAEDKPDE